MVSAVCSVPVIFTGPQAFLKDTATEQTADTMGFLSVSTHRGLVRWQGLLLVVSFLNFWSLPTTEQMIIVSKSVTEGEDVLLRIRESVRMPILLVSNTTVTENKDAVVMTCYSNAVSTQWLFNGVNLQLSERVKLSEYHRRLTIDPVKKEDAGNYQCKVSNIDSSVESVPFVLTVKSE
ncbi:cell adhesion molecule CEACAM21-like isoform 3-T3 [Glossophaga mutica]